MNHQARAKEVLHEVAHDAIVALADEYPDERSLDLDWQALHAQDPDLANDLLRQPEAWLDRLEEALRTYDEASSEVDTKLGLANVRLQNLPDDETHVVGQFKPARLLNRLVSLKGQITKRTEVLPKIDEGAFQCFHCGTLNYREQPIFGKIREPFQCEDCERQGPFWMNETQSTWVDYQKVRLQQPPEEAKGETENIDIHVLDDLSGHAAIEGGQRVTFTGRLIPVRKKGNVVHKKMVVGNAIEPEQKAFEDLDTDAHRQAINALARHPTPHEVLVDAYAPGHEGDELVKLACVLQLFSGWARYAPDGTYHRGDSHMYLIGDPGTGKTNLLQAMYEIAPRAVLTDGTGSSAAGLTAALTKDSFSDQQWSIEAGTLVLADEGIAIVDELDKGDPDDLKALHTALESQQVHVSKAGKNATLPAKAALLAAGNPTGGHFDPTAEFASQVELQSPLLSRFDLIFAIRGKEDEETLTRISDRMLDTRNIAGRLARGEDVSAAERALVEPDLDQEVFAAYVAEAKDLKPVWRDEAVKAEMKRWFVETKTSLPSRYQTTDQGEYDGPPLPVTARKLAALERLAEASARLRHSEVIEVADVDLVKPLLDRSLADIGIEPRTNAAVGRADQGLDAGEIGL